MHEAIKRAKETRMIEALLILGGMILGGGAVALIKGEKPSDDKTSQGQQEVIKQLTNLDVIKDLCSPEKVTNIEDRLLCRSMSCLVYSRTQPIVMMFSGDENEPMRNGQKTPLSPVEKRERPALVLRTDATSEGISSR